MHTFSVSRYGLLVATPSDATWYFRLQATLAAVLANRIIFHIRATASEETGLTTELYELSESNNVTESRLIFRGEVSQPSFAIDSKSRHSQEMV